MKNLILIFGFYIFSLSSFSITILIDPGHGGEDTGARTYLKKQKKMINEKDITLNLAKLIKKGLEKNKEYKVYLTRSVDRFVSLHDRAAVADKIKADLFISIHANASRRKGATGIETYYLDNHNDAAVSKVERVENKNFKGEDIVINKILTDLVISQTVKKSRELTRFVHESFQKKILKKFKMVDRGIRPGLFYVLVLAKRPAVLLEAGFLSNKKEREKVRSKKFQKAYADAVVLGVQKYIRKNYTIHPSLF